LPLLEYGLTRFFNVKHPEIKIPALCGKVIRKIAVFGAGKSGLAIAKRLGKDIVFITEEKSTLDKETLNSLKQIKVRNELGGHTDKALKGTDLIVVSPGIHLDIPILIKARKRNIPIIGEIELASYFISKPIIAITGTNGKTTTTALIGQMLKDSGYKVAVAGNIGIPLISVNDKKFDYIVAEISSYQLESVFSFRPWISLILNITEDHLTRHHTMKEYIKQKAAIFKNQRGDDHLIYNIDDRIVRTLSNKAKCKKIAFSRKESLEKGICAINGSIYFDHKRICSIKDIAIKGEHNIENALAAIAAAFLCKVSIKSIMKTLGSFKGVEHRIEFVKISDGISYYNDSKGTNPDSTIVAIQALRPSHNIVLILGGRDKMTDLTEMCRMIKDNVRDVVLIGEAKNRFKMNLIKNGFNRIHEASTFKEAINRSNAIAKQGDAVLLSPACASFDMFANFEERGKVFKQIVAKL
jgi:UDP-N-acetylmuramoylalanine--D-glutamate ligase